MNNCYTNDIAIIIIIIVLIVIIVLLVLFNTGKHKHLNYPLAFLISCNVVYYTRLLTSSIIDCKKRKKKDEEKVINDMENMTIPGNVNDKVIKVMDKMADSSDISEEDKKNILLGIQKITNGNINKLDALKKYFYDLKPKAIIDNMKSYNKYVLFITEVQYLICVSKSKHRDSK